MKQISTVTAGLVTLFLVVISLDMVHCRIEPDLLPEPLDPCFPIIMCKCPFGTNWSIDSKGCPRCSCKPQCPLYKCPQRDCPHGVAKDANGCPTCGCAPGPICLRARCDPGLKCPNGLATDANGCIICKCKPCPAVLCDNFCSNGYMKNSNGCDTCRCKPTLPVCPPLCRMHCPNGFVRDSNGCRICKCKPFKPVCGPVCMIYCPFGNVLDSKGCPTCQCRDPKPPLCPLIACPAVACPPGFENRRDRNGCRVGCSCQRIGLQEM